MFVTEVKNNIYNKYLQSIEHDDIEKIIINKKIERFKLNAKCNQDVLFGVTQLIKSSYPIYTFNNVYAANVNVVKLKSDYSVFVKNMIKSGYYYRRNCSLCKKGPPTYEYKLCRSGNTGFSSCDECIYLIIKFADRQVKDIGNKKISQIWLLLKQTPVYQCLDIDCFCSIFRLIISN